MWFVPGHTDMSSLRAIGAVIAVSYALVTASLAERPYVAAQAWDFDSINPVHPTETVHQIAAQQAYAALVRMVDSWNSHDLEGYLDVYWHSPELLWVEEGVVLNGWQSLHDRYVRGFNDLNAMGRATIARIQIKMTDADNALALEHWAIAFPGSGRTVAGVDTATLRRVDGVWKITVNHSSYLDL